MRRNPHTIICINNLYTDRKPKTGMDLSLDAQVVGTLRLKTP